MFGAVVLRSLRRASVIGQAQARQLPDRNFLITAGSFIPCVLQTAMDSSQPGYVSCIVPRNVYSDNGRVVLLEKGTKIFGEYQGGLNRGQYRLFVLWTRAVTPRGIAIDVGSPATDALGRGGVDGKGYGIQAGIQQSRSGKALGPGLRRGDETWFARWGDETWFMRWGGEALLRAHRGNAD